MESRRKKYFLCLWKREGVPQHLPRSRRHGRYPRHRISNLLQSSNNQNIHIMQSNQSNSSVACQVTWQISVQWGGQYRTSPAYNTYQEALEDTGKFLKQFQGHFLNVTYVRNVKYIDQGQAKA